MNLISTKRIINLRHLLIVLSALVTIFVFQNCSPQTQMTSQSDNVLAGGNTDSTANGNISQAILDNQQMQQVKKSTLDFEHYSVDNRARYSLDLQTDVATNLESRRSCVIASSSAWQQMKKLIMEKGICKYSYPLADNQVRCMAYPMPYASLVLQEMGKEVKSIELAGSICLNEHNEVCGEENAKNFREKFEVLKSELFANANCK